MKVINFFVFFFGLFWSFVINNIIGWQENQKRKQNPFLQDNYAPVKDEVDAEVQITKDSNTIPKDFPRGMYIRNGPNPQFTPKPSHHWFEGDGMLHSVQITEDDRTAVYKNRFIHTERYLVETEFQNSVLVPFAEDASPFSHLLHMYRTWVRGAEKIPSINSANTSLKLHHNQFFALYESNLPTRIELPSLETLGVYDFKGQLKQQNVTAHPIVDPKTGEMIFFGYMINDNHPYLHYGIVDKHGKVTLQTDLHNLPFATMHHCFAVTPQYTVFMLFPLYFGKENILDGKAPVMFYKDRPSKFAVIKRYHHDGDEIKYFELESCYMFHIFNSYEEGKEIVIQGCVTDYLNFTLTGKNPNPKVKEFRLNLESGTASTKVVKFKPLDGSSAEPIEIPCEFPIINDDYATLKHRFGFASYVGLNGLQCVVKLDFDTKTFSICEAGGMPGEYVFVPKVGAKDEDDGYLCTFVYHAKDNTSTFQIIDGKDLGKSITKFKLPRRVPQGFHGIYVTNDQMKNIN